MREPPTHQEPASLFDAPTPRPVVDVELPVGEPGPTWPLRRVRAWLDTHRGQGVRCPACDQLAKVYRRKVTSTAAHALVMLWLNSAHDFAHLPTVRGANDGEAAKLAYWGLIEEERTLRPDGGRSGWWRVTDAGEAFLRGQTVAKYALVYDGDVLGYEGPDVSIHDALGTRFDLAELMAGR